MTSELQNAFSAIGAEVVTAHGDQWFEIDVQRTDGREVFRLTYPWTDTVTAEVETAAVEQEPEPVPPTPQPAIGYLDLAVEPGASIYIDGEKRIDGTHTGTIELEAGIHGILCKKEGYREYSESITITRGEMSRRRIILQRVKGGVFFNTTPGAMIYIDGIYKGLTPTDKPIMLPSGNCRIELKKVGYRTWSSDVYIPPDETIWLDIKLSPQ